ncbi:hypothetical protein MKUB_14700 [Mycobacterium kubicae]|uniref:Uncharacterized protein n=1 Tax=Mycobacterium kubicae TaxID=120959 RepID=A0ABQ1BJW8_9MYCO|nr:hypothetical protein AWC13_00540 [Mycobacterium kubicae]GFG63980.1 hypothetical protein MKUB_14700 [Mycobacterium kubicae]
MLVGANAARFAALIEEAIPSAPAAAEVIRSGVANKYDIVVLPAGKRMDRQILARFARVFGQFTDASGAALHETSERRIGLPGEPLTPI